MGRGNVEQMLRKKRNMHRVFLSCIRNPPSYRRSVPEISHVHWGHAIIGLSSIGGIGSIGGMFNIFKQRHPLFSNTSIGFPLHGRCSHGCDSEKYYENDKAEVGLEGGICAHEEMVSYSAPICVQMENKQGTDSIGESQGEICPYKEDEEIEKMKNNGDNRQKIIMNDVKKEEKKKKRKKMPQDEKTKKEKEKHDLDVRTNGEKRKGKNKSCNVPHKDEKQSNQKNIEKKKKNKKRGNKIKDSSHIKDDIKNEIPLEDKKKNKISSLLKKKEINKMKKDYENEKKKKKKQTKKMEIENMKEIRINLDFNKENYFNEFQNIGKKNGVIMNRINKIEDIYTFVSKNKQNIGYDNIHAYNNFLYEIYDKFSNADIKKVKKLINNYNKLTKKNLQKKIKYFETFYEMCPQNYRDVLTCLFIQSVDVLKGDDISYTFYYDQVLHSFKENEEEISYPEEERTRYERSDYKEEEEQKEEQEEEQEEDNKDDCHRGLRGNHHGCDNYVEGKEQNSRAKHRQSEYYTNKIVHEINVHFRNSSETDCINEKNFVMVYNLPIISYEVLREELKETFSFCGEIKNIEFFSDRLKTVDVDVLNDEALTYQGGNNGTNSLNVTGGNNGNDNYEELGSCEKKSCVKGSSTIRRGRKNSTNENNPNSYTKLYGIIEFYDEKSAELATSDFLRIFGIFCYKKLIYVDRCVNKKIMIVTHLPFHLNIYNILYMLLNASLCKVDISYEERESARCLSDDCREESSKQSSHFDGIEKGLDKNGKESNNMERSRGDFVKNSNPLSDGAKKLGEQLFVESEQGGHQEGDEMAKCEFVLRNGNVKIENREEFLSYDRHTGNFSDVYDYICEISKKNFLKFKEEKHIKLDMKKDEKNINKMEEKNNSFQSFYDFYEKNKKMKTRSLVMNNNGRILILHFDNFKNLFYCFKKFKYIFKNKNCMIFSLNLRRCIYLNGEIRDNVHVNSWRGGTP
ncbi:hypothetical protein, conserved [Plasmodium ovale wallikeri]|uniref:RRM domain-containing protein n=1 Tax=Plasmodium ovale wallikeri TaxID=864142 RepID=A0A1A8YMJ2_PLAOA|nr:hypothetical protein, conserved [Plasmodium ovale wallikeri]SBT32586.1 hypothetical protein, conserved [Plasmodium ovale wallikeri]